MDEMGGQKQTPGRLAETSPIVKCDVCGQSFNRRHLSSHKRRSHSKSDSSVLGIRDEAKAVETILALYLPLSTASRTEVLKRLTSLT